MIELADTPDFWQLKREFLAFVESRHAEFGFSMDFRSICDHLGIKVGHAEIPDKRSSFTVMGNQPLILLDSSERATRSAFSLAHELCHYFFDDDEHAFKAILAEAHSSASQETLRNMEEELCHSGAAILLFPSGMVRQALSQHGLHPQAVVDIAEDSIGSLHAALRRVVDTHMDLQLWGFIVDRTDRIEFQHRTQKYQARKRALLPPTHPVLAARSLGYVDVKAAAHFRHSWRIPMRAIEHHGRIIVIAGSSPLPATPDSIQGALFPGFLAQN